MISWSRISAVVNRLMEEVIPLYPGWFIFRYLLSEIPRGVRIGLRLICMEKLLVMDPRLSDFWVAHLHRESIRSPWGEWWQESRRQVFPCDIKAKATQHSIPSLLLNEATAAQFQDHIGGLRHFLAVGDGVTFWRSLANFFKIAMMSPAVWWSRFPVGSSAKMTRCFWNKHTRYSLLWWRQIIQSNCNSEENPGNMMLAVVAGPFGGCRLKKACPSWDWL